MKPQPNWILILGVGLVFGLVTTLSLIDPKAPRAPLPNPDDPDFMFEGVKVYQLDDGKVLWELNAKAATITKADNQIKLQHMRGTFFQTPRSPVYLSAPDALLGIKNANLHLQNARAQFSIGPNHYNLKTQNLFWNPDKQILTGVGNVKINSGQISILGHHLKANIPIRKIKITENPYARIAL